MLRAFLPALARLGLPWGPTGGLGFALATGLPVLHAGSDIDLLVRAPAPLSQAQGQVLAALVETVERATCMVDIQIDTRFGGFAFKEWTACDPGRVGGAALPGAAPQRVAEARRVLLKTEAGPILVRDPWRRQPAEGLQVQHPRPGPAASTARGFDQAL